MILGESNKRTKLKMPDETYWRGQRPLAKILLKKIKKNELILEMGIGKGGVVKYLVQKEPNLNIIGFDINKTSLQKAKLIVKKQCNGTLKLAKLSQDINLADKFGKDKFDVVISCGVLDYAKDPDNVIKNVKKILKKGGYFAFTIFDNLSSFEYDGKSPKQRYISTAGIKTWGYRDYYIKNLLKKLGFTLCSISHEKKLHKNTPKELSHIEISAIRKKLDTPYDDHFIILAKKK